MDSLPPCIILVDDGFSGNYAKRKELFRKAAEQGLIEIK